MTNLLARLGKAALMLVKFVLVAIVALCVAALVWAMTYNDEGDRDNPLE